ncbi:MAG TPA: TIGR02678 family protein [Acidimicrobiales bacterium]|nr:TIGR02678 family protein [Acidimicrobiales bacterium]
MSDNPQDALERQHAARHLIQQPFTCAEHDAEMFRLIRRHASDLDRWFTQRLGYRLHLDADTARLFKSGVLVEHRALRTSTDRAFHQLEYILLALVLASTAAGPAIISLRDLVDQIRSAAAEADIVLSGDATERRALVTVLRWMIDHGLAVELHSHIDAYAGDDSADAVLKVRPDRITLMPLPALVGVDDADELLRRAERRTSTRQWLRARLVETPVIYREDLTDDEWSELRRRLGEEDRILDEMFGLILEARAEGVAAIDPSGSLAERRFPSGGTVGHCALLLIDELRDRTTTPWPDVIETVAALAARHAKRWANDLVNAPERLARQAIDLLVEQRLAERIDEPTAIRVLAGAARFAPLERDEAEPASAQDALW